MSCRLHTFLARPACQLLKRRKIERPTWFRGSFTSQTACLDPTENSRSSFVIESQYYCQRVLYRLTLYTIMTVKSMQRVKKKTPSM